jgi:hypothetical protein
MAIGICKPMISTAFAATYSESRFDELKNNRFEENREK